MLLPINDCIDMGIQQTQVKRGLNQQTWDSIPPTMVGNKTVARQKWRLNATI
jgi:hypothetical protein